MSYRNLKQCIDDLEATRQLVRIREPVDVNLEAAEIQRRVYRAGGPAIYFANVVGCRFPMVSNLFGTMERVRYIFRDSIERLQQLVALQIDPSDLMRRPRLYWKAPWTALLSRPRKVRSGPVLDCETVIGELPQLKSWPGDGGAYITLPQVYSEDPEQPGFARSNLGMYRVQMSGGEYEQNREVGLHYQIQRGIAAHHAAAMRKKTLLPINVFVGGPPAMSVAAVMPLPEGMSELAFAGVLGRRRVPMICRNDQLPIHAEADFCITGYIDPLRLKTEGPFGDHLGYYSLAHEFPVMQVARVYHRQGAIWPFTVVGRPPQEDTMFGQLIHELVGPIIPKTIPGVREVHAVDAAGVHPLLLAVGTDRYVPYVNERRPRELLTLANALLGHGQLSLAKYVWIAAAEDAPDLTAQNVPEFLRHMLERVNWQRDLHFQTCTTLDTLDYSSGRLNEGSKVVVAAAGPPTRMLPVACDRRITLPEHLGFRKPRVVLPGILVVEGPAYTAASEPEPPVCVSYNTEEASHGVPLLPRSSAGRGSPAGTACEQAVAHGGEKCRLVAQFCACYNRRDLINGFPLIVVADNSDFASRTLNDFLWTTFTKSDPAADVYGIESFIEDKHWGCFGSLVIDARSKPHHAPPLVEDPEVTRRVDALAAPGGPLHGLV